MPRDPERQRRHAAMLNQASPHTDGLARAPFSDKVDGWLTRWDEDPSGPAGLVLIDADGDRRILDEHLPVWMLPAILLALGLVLGLFVVDGLVGRVLLMGCFAPVGFFFYAHQMRIQRHLLVDASRRAVIVFRGRRALVEIPFEDIDEIFVEVKADPGYSDQLRAVASIGATSLPLTRWTIDISANMAANAVAEVAGARRDNEPRRLKPHT